MPNVSSKSQYFKKKWDGVEEPTTNNFYKIDNRKTLRIIRFTEELEGCGLGGVIFLF